MTVPTSYTEKTLADFMAETLKTTADLLGLAAGASDAGDFAEAVNEALLQYGVTDVSEISGIESIKKIRALARVEAWNLAVACFTAMYKFSADGGSYDRNQLFEQAKQNRDAAVTDALAFSANYSVKTGELRYLHDPYKYLPDNMRPL